MTQLEAGKALRTLTLLAQRSAARILVDDPTQAEDVAQRIVRRLLERRSLAEILELGAAYFEAAGRREAIATLRDERRRSVLLAGAVPAVAAPPRRPDQAFAEREFVEAVREWLARDLPPRTAEIAHLAWFERWTSQRIADRLGVAVKRVERHRKLARERFATRFPELVPRGRPSRRQRRPELHGGGSRPTKR